VTAPEAKTGTVFVGHVPKTSKKNGSLSRVGVDKL